MCVCACHAYMFIVYAYRGESLFMLNVRSVVGKQSVMLYVHSVVGKQSVHIIFKRHCIETLCNYM